MWEPTQKDRCAQLTEYFYMTDPSIDKAQQGLRLHIKELSTAMNEHDLDSAFKELDAVKKWFKIVEKEIGELL